MPSVSHSQGIAPSPAKTRLDFLAEAEAAFLTPKPKKGHQKKEPTPKPAKVATKKKPTAEEETPQTAENAVAA